MSVLSFLQSKDWVTFSHTITRLKATRTLANQCQRETKQKFVTVLKFLQSSWYFEFDLRANVRLEQFLSVRSLYWLLFSFPLFKNKHIQELDMLSKIISDHIVGNVFHIWNINLSSFFTWVLLKIWLACKTTYGQGDLLYKESYYYCSSREK